MRRNTVKVCPARRRPPSLRPHRVARPQRLRPQRSLHRFSHLPHLAWVQMVFPVKAKQVHVTALRKSRRSENSYYSTVFMCTPPFCAVIQIVIFILVPRDTMCYGEDDHDRGVKNTMSKGMSVEESDRGAKVLLTANHDCFFARTSPRLSRLVDMIQP